MTGKSNISTAKRILLLALGLNVAFFAVAPKAQEAMYKNSADYIDRGLQEEESKEKSAEFLMAYEAIVPIVQFHIDHELIFVLDLFVSEEEPVETKPESRLVFNNYFKVLFRQIISPNAP